MTPRGISKRRADYEALADEDHRQRAIKALQIAARLIAEGNMQDAGYFVAEGHAQYRVLLSQQNVVSGKKAIR